MQALIKNLVVCLLAMASGLSLAAAPAGAAPPNAVDALRSRFVVEVNADGFLVDQLTGKPIKQAAQARSYLDRTVFKSYRASGITNILVFVHGGLVDKNNALSYFASNYTNILDGQYYPKYYPIYIVWPSGWVDTYREHVLLVRGGVKAETASGRLFSYGTSPFVLLADFGRAAVRLPLVIANDSKSDVDSSRPVRDSNEQAAVKQFNDLARHGYQLEVGNDYSTRGELFWKHVRYWCFLPSKWLCSALLDGLGTGAWDNMIRRTEEAYPAQMDRGRSNQIQQDLVSSTNRPDSSGGPLSQAETKRAARFEAAGLPIFVNQLCGLQDSPGFGEITLVGHSMGAMILNRVLADSNIKAANIVYMAAACSTEDFTKNLLPYMKNHPATQFYNLSLYSVAEASDTEASEFCPRGSLLIWIDNFFGNPVSEQQRTLGAWENLFLSTPTGEPVLRQTLDDPQFIDLKPRLHFRAFSTGAGVALRDHGRPADQWNDNATAVPLAARQDNPLTHGSFSEMPYWTHDFWWSTNGVAP